MIGLIFVECIDASTFETVKYSILLTRDLFTNTLNQIIANSTLCTGRQVSWTFASLTELNFASKTSGEIQVGDESIIADFTIVWIVLNFTLDTKSTILYTTGSFASFTVLC